MWLRKLYLKLKLYFINNYYLPEQINEQHLAYIEALDLKLFKEFSVIDTCMLKINVLYINLDTYVSKLKYINVCLDENKYINNDWCRYVYTEITLEKFLIDNKNLYSNQNDILNEFKKQYTIYCKHILHLCKYQAVEQEHNLRILTAFSTHLNAITLFFLRYSHGD